jgi:hypothetical protein
MGFPKESSFTTASFQPGRGWCERLETPQLLPVVFLEKVLSSLLK